jgi:type IV secretory pathway TrbD component
MTTRFGDFAASIQMRIGTHLGDVASRPPDQRWAIFSIIVAVVLVIGPIGWAALIFGLPIWTLGTGLLLARTPRTVTRREAAPAVS